MIKSVCKYMYTDLHIHMNNAISYLMCSLNFNFFVFFPKTKTISIEKSHIIL
jgi:hypothetical protein